MNAVSWEQFFQSMTDPVMVVDRDHRIIRANQATVSVTGREESKLLGDRCNQVFHCREEPPENCPLERMKLTDLPATRDIEVEALDRWFSVTVSPLRSNGSREILHVARDVTARVQAERALENSENRYRSLFEDSRDGIFIFSLDGGIIEANRAGLDMLGCDAGDLTGFDFKRDLIAGSREGGTMIDRIIAAGYLEDQEAGIRRSDGSLTDIIFSASIRYDERGEPSGIEATARDVSIRKRMEERLLQMHRMESVGRLAGGVAHEMNNILTAIRGHAELAGMSLQQEDAALSDLSELIQAVSRAEHMTSQLLAFSSQQRIERKAVSIDRTVAQFAGTLELMLGIGYQLDTSIKGDIWPVEVDPAMLKQALMNLVINARDAMPDGGRIELGIENVQTEHEVDGVRKPVAAVRIQVRDRGKGIAPEDLPHIFEPFYAFGRPGRGAGLELAVAHGIIGNHGGWIDAESAAGKGSIFSVHLIASEGGRDGEGGVGGGEERTAKDVAGPGPGSGAVILLVEDEAAVRHAGSTWLERNGYSVYAAEDAEQAREIFAENRESIDLVFTDVVMPGESGLDMARAFRKMKPELKIVIASGFGGDKADPAEIEAEGFPFLQKPYGLTQLLEIVNEQLA